MRILVLCYEYPPIGGGGGRAAQSISEELVARGHEIRVQTAALGWGSLREEEGGVEIFRTASGRRLPDTCAVHEMALYCATSFLPALRHIRAWKPEVIHAHFAVPTGLVAWAVHLLSGTPYVLTTQLGDVPGGVPEQTDTLFKLAGPAARQVWKHAAAATAVSSFVQELGERTYHRPVIRIANGIDMRYRLAAPPLENAVRHFVFVGRFSPQKQPQIFIDALAKLTGSSWRATLVGDGPLMPAVRGLIEKNRLHNVRLTGWLAAPEVQGMLASADALVMPSLSEGLPVAAVESLKHGLAIVASDIPGVHDVVDDGVNGYRVPVRDSQALAHRLQTLIECDSILRTMKRSSWEKARAFDIKEIAGQYEQVLRSASACHTGA